MLEEYHKKRNFTMTPEPRGNTKQSKENKNKFVVQKHDATRLHYDFRLEDKKEGVLKSWAVPKGISLDSKMRRLAVLTEDHPLDYLLFEGVIPEGSYGAGTVIVWDTGTYTSEGEISDQFENGKITFTLFGQKLRGRFSLVRTSEKKQWLLIKSSDEFASNEDLTITRPESVLSGRINEDLERYHYKKDRSSFAKAVEISEKVSNHRRKKGEEEKYGGGDDATATSDADQQEEFPTKIKPMLSTLVNEPFNNKDWVFEVKWDGVRSILFFHKTKGILEMQSRNGKSITHRYPEIIKALKSISSAIKCKESAILDGEIVVSDKKNGIPNFQDHQRRMNINNIKEIEILSRQIPATYYFFDILYLDGKDLQRLPFLERRKILSETIEENSRIRISDFIEEIGKEIFDKTKSMGLEGIVAKHKSSKYLQGIRSRDWLKIKNIKTQDCIIIGYTKGEGNRENYFGSLLLAAYDSKSKLRFVGHTGSGFDFDQLEKVYERLQKMKVEKCQISYVPYTNRDPVWIKPELVAEIKFSNWTGEKIMRAPIFLRFREDKIPKDCIIEEEIEKHVEEIIKQQEEIGKHNNLYSVSSSSPSSSFSFSNLDKVFWDKARNHPQLTKKDLIEYYDKISSYILPYLKDRPLSLSRYPDGIKGKSFYHKNWNQEKPAFVQAVKVYSESREDNIINYLVCNNKETLLWLANLGCIEIHPWYSRINDFHSCNEKDDILYEEKCGLNFPDFIIFDLDPYIYSGVENKGQEPEYNLKAFKATVDVAYSLKELFDELKIESYVKTSGKTGLHIFVPIATFYAYEQTRRFAEIIGKILKRRYPQKITMEWDTIKREGKVFFDHNQNARGKTIASIFSARPSSLATVSMPARWEDLSSILPTDFTMLNVPQIVKKSVNPWKDILERKQDINKILENVSEIFV
jgi:bifunctional non-homologous end joining protein LigD